MMKRSLLFIALSFVLSAIANAGPAFDAGYRAGFKTGYQQNHGQYSIAPICPIPPIPPVGEDNYENGFKYGLFEGVSQ
jgi:hypothetical protein